MSKRADLRDTLIAAGLVVFAVFALISAHTYSRASGLFPIFVGWVFLGLCVLELLKQVWLLVKQETTTLEKAQSPTSGADSGKSGGAVWLLLFLVVLYLGGFLLAIPLFTLLFLRVAAGRRLRLSFAVAAGLTFFVVVVFGILLDYRLYPGVFLAG